LTVYYDSILTSVGCLVYYIKLAVLVEVCQCDDVMWTSTGGRLARVDNKWTGGRGVKNARILWTSFYGWPKNGHARRTMKCCLQLPNDSKASQQQVRKC